MWSEIEKNYTRSDRHYHTLAHLESLLQKLLPYRSNFAVWDTLIFALTYHDAIYNVLKSNNEERSASLAVKRLSGLSLPESVINTCAKMIMATKRHEDIDEETNLFTDADLSILGTDAKIYLQYTKEIRLEYRIYPDLVYVPGRKKVIDHFLSMKRIYKTEPFFSRYEENARINLEFERKGL